MRTQGTPLPNALVNAVHSSLFPTRPPYANLTDVEMEAWIEVFREQLGLPEGAQPNFGLLELPPVPSYGCRPRDHSRRDDEDSGHGPSGGRLNPARALFHREPQRKRPLERASSERDRKETSRSKHRQLRREGGPNKKK